MEYDKKSSKPLEDFDINGHEFYNNLQDEIEVDIARLKKSVEVVKKLRTAEMEVETAALYHAELWRDIEDLKLVTKADKA